MRLFHVSLLPALIVLTASVTPGARPATEADPPPPPVWDKVPLPDLKESAGAGDAAAMAELGERYLFGRGVPVDNGEALRWFRLAADKGNAHAMERLGGMYRDGLGVERDYDRAMAWYRKAADKGDLAALAGIGWMHYHGLGVKQ